MVYEIVFTDTAKELYRDLDAPWRSSIKQALEAHLRHEPAKISKSRIKRLRDIRQPEYRLRVDDYRIFYDIDIEARHVVIAAIVPKGDAANWLMQHGIRET